MTQCFDPASFNKLHNHLLARSWKAQPIGVYMYLALWSFLLAVIVAVGLSFVTRARAESELKDLVMGLTKVPDEGRCPWYQRPALWATLVLIGLVTINFFLCNTSTLSTVPGIEIDEATPGRRFRWSMTTAIRR